MKNVIYAIFLTFLLISCKDKKQDQKALVENDTSALQTTQEFLNTENEHPDTIKVDYSAYDDLLDILMILPTSTMIGWEWKPNERREFVKFIKQNNFEASNYENFELGLIKPNTLSLSMYGGYFFTLSIYKIKPSNYIVIANDYEGRDNVTAFEYYRGKFKAIKIEELFGDIFLELLIDKNDPKCLALLNEKIGVFEYYFQDITKVEISSIYYLKEKECKHFLRGNTLNYQFNPKTKKFDLLSVNWTEYNDE